MRNNNNNIEKKDKCSVSRGLWHATIWLSFHYTDYDPFIVRESHTKTSIQPNVNTSNAMKNKKKTNYKNSKWFDTEQKDH